MRQNRVERRRRLAPWLLAAASLPVAAAHAASRYEVDLGTDYRRAALDWNIAGDLSGTNPNVLSELRWHDLEIAQVNATLRAEAGPVVLEATGVYGVIVSGKNRDSDYLADNRQLEFSRSDSESGGTVAEAGLGLGYRYRLYDATLRHYGDIIPMVGYSLHCQDLNIRNGVQTVPATGPIAGLDSHYDTQWQGPWLGARLQLKGSPRTVLSFDFAYHFADYLADGNWNLRNDLAHPVSFRHQATGSGLVAAAAVSYRWNRRWSLAAHLDAEDWTAGPGVDTFFAVDTNTGKVQPEATRLNVVHWKSGAVGVSAEYRF